MSKKNNKATKRRVHAADLARERADAAARAAKAAKRAAREERQRQEEGKNQAVAPLAPSLHATSGGRVLKKQKRNAVARAVRRVKKGTRVGGIRVIDAETKAAARAAVRASAAAALALGMEIDNDGGTKKKSTAATAAGPSSDKVMADA